MPTVEQIVDLLKKQPLEDVYSMNFARKKITKEILRLKIDSFKAYYSECDDFFQKKIRYFTNWIEDKIENENLKYFPSYLEVYLEGMYEPNGLKLYISNYLPEVILSRKLDSNVDRSEFLKEFELNLTHKSWWTKSDTELWERFQEKRLKVELFEEYIYALNRDLKKCMSEDIEKYPDNYPKIFDKHKDHLRFEISALKLFEGDSLKVVTLERLIEYFTELCKKESIYFGQGYEMNVYLSSNEGLEFINSYRKEELYQREDEQRLKINLLHQFGIINYLKVVWSEKKIKRPISHLISTLISAPVESVQPRLSKSKDPVARTKSALKKLKEFMQPYGLELDEIINSQEKKS